MTTTAEIARAHAHIGPRVCHECGTAANLHFLIWGNPETGESGDFLECCGCGIAAGDPAELHDECEPDEDPAADEEPEAGVRVFRCADGWVRPDYTDLADCTTNFHRQQDGRPPCTDPAVWKVVEEHTNADGYPMLTIGFYCDADLPAEHRTAA
jgi:hypothetical protein